MTSTLPIAATAAALMLAVPAKAAPVLPDFGAAVFEPSTVIDNPYFPVRPNAVRTYEGTDEEGETERAVQSYAGAGPELLGVQTTSVRDRVAVDGVVVEDTFDYFAQDAAGNVWYFGEDVTNYRYDEEGALIGTDTASAWLSGENGALPGYIMPADPEVGFSYYQEFAEADEALDQGTIFAKGQTVTIGLGTYGDVLAVLESNPFEPDVRELKYYAPGQGLILAEEDLDEGFSNPGCGWSWSRSRRSRLPAGLPLLGAALGGLAVLRRRASRRQASLRA